MLTWLDQYTAGFGHEVRTKLANDFRAQGMAVPSDYQIMRQVTTESASRSIDAANLGLMADDESEYFSALWPFFLRPDELRFTPHACAVGRDLARLFAGAAASDEIADRADAFAKEKFITYIDVADRAFRLGQTHHLKAILILRIPRPGRYTGEHAADKYIPDDSDRLRITAVVGPIGELARARMVWDPRSQEFYCDEAFEAVLSDLLQQSGTTIEDIASDIENFVWLTLAYAAVAEPRAREILPAVADNLRDRTDRAARKQRQHFSLFRVERLRPPADNFGRHAVNGDGRGWELGRRIAVRGHFKMQPHGTKNEFRRLIFVAPHFRGPLDGAPLHRITTFDT